MITLGERFIYRGKPMTLRALFRMLNRLWGEHGTLLVTISKDIGKRSNQQNSYMWLIIDQIGPQLGSTDKERTKNFLTSQCFGERHENINGIDMPKYVKTKELTSKQMSYFLDWCIAYATDQGIEILIPPEYAAWSTEAKRGTP